MVWETKDEPGKNGYPEQLVEETDYEYYWFKIYCDVEPKDRSRNMGGFIDYLDNKEIDSYAATGESPFTQKRPGETNLKIYFHENIWDERAKAHERLHNPDEPTIIWEINKSWWKDPTLRESYPYPKQLKYEDDYCYSLFKLYCTFLGSWGSDGPLKHDISEFYFVLSEGVISINKYGHSFINTNDGYLRIPYLYYLEGIAKLFKWQERKKGKNVPIDTNKNLMALGRHFNKIWMCRIKSEVLVEPEESYAAFELCIEKGYSLKKCAHLLNLDYDKVLIWALEYKYYGRACIFLKEVRQWKLDDIIEHTQDLKREIDGLPPISKDQTEGEEEEEVDDEQTQIPSEDKITPNEYVYVVTNPSFANTEDGVKCKIGKTSDWDKRLKGLNNTSVPDDFELVILFGRVRGEYNLESELHTIFKRYHYAKEFFDLPFKAFLNLRYNTLLSLDLNDKGWDVIECAPGWEQRFEDYLIKQREVQV